MSEETDDIRSPFYRKGAFRYVNGERVPVDTIEHHHVLDSLKTEISGRIEGWRQGQKRAQERRTEEHRERREAYEKGRREGMRKRAYEEGRREGRGQVQPRGRQGGHGDLFGALDYAGAFIMGGPSSRPRPKPHSSNRTVTI